ncbi:hypothetical protein ACFP8W_15675, partial [Nocardioides hankookensis]
MRTVEGIQEPVARPLHLVLRRAVADHAARERRRLHPPLLHVGWPGAADDFAAGSRAALAGGVTTFIEFAVQVPGDALDDVV